LLVIHILAIVHKYSDYAMNKKFCLILLFYKIAVNKLAKAENH